MVTSPPLRVSIAHAEAAVRSTAAGIRTSRTRNLFAFALRSGHRWSPGAWGTAWARGPAPPGAVRGTGLPEAPGGALERALDATAAMMGEPEAASALVPDVSACLEAHGLLGFADAGWRGTAACYAYAADGSTRSPCDWGKAAGAAAGYAEYDRRSLADGAQGGQVLWEVFEPCNVASNVAYYRSMLELCRRGDGAADGALAALAALAWGR